MSSTVSISKMFERLESRLLFVAGDLDPTFGGGDGRVPMPAGGDVLLGVQPDGRIILADKQPAGFRLLRLNPDGSPDASFLAPATLTEHAGDAAFSVNGTTGRI